MKRRTKLEVSPAAAVLLALLYFFDTLGITAAALPAAVVHELGHYAALRLCGGRLTKIRIGVFGAEMEYEGLLRNAGAVLCSAAGPLAGAVYAVCACTAGGRFLRMSGTVSFLLSAFNLLPVLPLDGGRMTEVILGSPAALCISRAVSAALLCFGAVLALEKAAWAPFLMGAWLTVHNFAS